MIDHPENSDEYKGLTVNAGVENLPSVNPYATFRRKKTVLTPEAYFEGIRRGDMTILSQAVTLVESNLLADQAIAQKVIELCLPYAGNSIRVGITGVPGAGKSTFIEALGSELCDYLAKTQVKDFMKRYMDAIKADPQLRNESRPNEGYRKEIMQKHIGLFKKLFGNDVFTKFGRDYSKYELKVKL